MSDTPKVNDWFSDGQRLHRIEAVTGNAFRVGDSWLMFDACEVYSHGAGTINYWRVRP